MNASRVLESCPFDVRPGELVAVMGRNGTGKSTLLRALMGLHTIDSGSARIAGLRPGVGSNAGDRQAGRVSAATGGQPALSRNGCGRCGGGAGEPGRESDRARCACSTGLRWGICATAIPVDLSAGEQERAALAVTLAGDPAVVLLDEPTRGMDALRKRELAELFVQLRERGVAILMATHDVELVAQVATRVMLLGDSGIVAQGGTREVLAGSLTFGTQMNRVFGNGWLTVDDVVRGNGADWETTLMNVQYAGMDRSA